jgi:hypothetical protein
MVGKTMKSLKKVYVVTDGCYSDYHIESIWDTEDKAKSAISILRKGDIEVWTLNTSLNNIKDEYMFRFDPNGKLDYENYCGKDLEEPTTTYQINGGELKGYIVVRLFTRGPRNKAFKIACDERAKFLAQKAGI